MVRWWREGPLCLTALVQVPTLPLASKWLWTGHGISLGQLTCLGNGMGGPLPGEITRGGCSPGTYWSTHGAGLFLSSVKHLLGAPTVSVSGLGRGDTKTR